jgi:ATP phosphoribosyltransferase regulatory subunit
MTPPVRLPVGVRDFLPGAAARRRAIAEALLETFSRWGYERIITPVLEYDDVLSRGLGEAGRQAALRFVEPATGDVVALRPDITPQVARLVATRLADAPLPIRLCYEGSVLRLAAGGRGQRELIQAGIELIGAPAPAGDAEILAATAAALDHVTLDVGHVTLVREALAGGPPELVGHVARKDTDAVVRAAKGLPAPQRKLLAALPELCGHPDDVLRRARALPISKRAKQALAEVEAALAQAAAAGGSPRFTLDLGEVRGFEYYTGLHFAGYVEGVGDAVVRGGRYDDLVGRYGRPAQATGMAIDVEAVAAAERGPGPPSRPAVQVSGTGAERVAQALRAAGLRAAVDLGAGPTTVPGWRNLALDAATLDGDRISKRAIVAARRGEAAHLATLVARPVKAKANVNVSVSVKRST